MVEPEDSSKQKESVRYYVANLSVWLYVRYLDVPGQDGVWCKGQRTCILTKRHAHCAGDHDGAVKNGGVQGVYLWRCGSEARFR